jgi:predicted MFS family arabinose efflux permease
VLGLTGLFYFAYGPLEVALPVFARGVLHTDALGYGGLWSSLGVGTLVGTLLVGALGRLGRTHVVLTLIMALWGLVVLILALATSPLAALVAMFVGGLVWGPYTALETTLLQRIVDPTTHGRLFGLRSMLLSPAAPLGTALGGLLLIGVSAQLVIALSGLACMLGAALAWQWMRRIPRQAIQALTPQELPTAVGVEK